MQQKTLNETLRDIADYTGLDVSTLSSEAHLDQIGGYNSNPAEATFPMGSIWGVEGQILYALIRALRPLEVLELGTFYGCSTTHIIAALEANREDYGDDVHLVTVDNGQAGGNPSVDCDFLTVVNDNILDYLNDRGARFDFLFEDSKHTAEFVEAVYRLAMPLTNEGGVIVSHDAAHHTVGSMVMQGIRSAGINPLVTLTNPSDCGLSVFRIPESELVDFEPFDDDSTERLEPFDPASFEDDIDTNMQPVFVDLSESKPMRNGDSTTINSDEWYQRTFADLEAMNKAELLQELEALNVDPNTIEGSGAGGNILKSDLIAALMTALKPQ